MDYYVIIGLVALYFVWQFFIYPKIRLHKIVDTIKMSVGEEVKITFPFKDKSRITFEDQNVIFDVKYISVPAYSLLTINSKVTWKVSYGGNPNKPGRIYPNERFLTELKPFLRAQSEEAVKIVILYGKVEKKVMYLNESELEILAPTSKPHGIYVLTLAEMKENYRKILEFEKR